MFEGRIFHFGSLSLTHEPARSATLTALKLARQRGMLVSYDPNLRPPLWASLTEAKARILSVMGRRYCEALPGRAGVSPQVHGTWRRALRSFAGSMA